MENRKRTLLQVPQGTESFYLEEAFRHRQLTRELERLFYSWGYLPAETPVFDFYDIYRPLLDHTTNEKVYRLIDREGELLMLRSDITLFLAKQMGAALREEDLPVRVCYFDTILRHQNSEDISRNEFFQTGAELIGKPGLSADLEVLMLLVTTLKLMELKEVVLHIGSRSLFTASFSGIPEHDRKPFLTAVTMRAFDTLRELLAERNFAAGRITFLITLYGFIGSYGDFQEFLRTPGVVEFCTPDEFVQLSYLGSVMEQLEMIGVSQAFRIDLSEIGNQPYHSGIVFQAYMNGMDSAIASGGRYDGLLGFFGFETPSVGFSLLLRKVEDHLGRPERFLPPATRDSVQGENFSESFAKAERLRREGRVVTL